MYVTGSTGTGKSTQVPKLLMYALKMIDYKDNGSIICTQPRIPPTINNAERISLELVVATPPSVEVLKSIVSAAAPSVFVKLNVFPVKLAEFKPWTAVPPPVTLTVFVIPELLFESVRLLPAA